MADPLYMPGFDPNSPQYIFAPGRIGALTTSAVVNGGGNAYGTRPNPVPYSSVYGQASQISPQLPGVQNQAWDTVSNQLNSTVSPATQRLLQDQAASMGVELGLPSWNAASEGTLARILGTAEQQQQQGVQNFQGLTNTTKSLTNDPATEYARQQQNNVWAAAPDPAAAAKLQQSLFDQYINSVSQHYSTGTYTRPTNTTAEEIHRFAAAA